MVFCVDTSAWHHAARPEVARRWLAALSADQIGICDHVRLEILYSANSATDYDALATNSTAWPVYQSVPKPLRAHAKSSVSLPTSPVCITAA